MFTVVLLFWACFCFDCWYSFRVACAEFAFYFGLNLRYCVLVVLGLRILLEGVFMSYEMR